ncbi:VC0807 family protein [Streptomyces sp. NPDC001709]
MADAAETTGRVRRTGTRTGKGTGRGTRSGTAAPRRGAAAYGPLLTVAADILLPLLVYYAARALGTGQGPALLLSGAPPALRLVSGAVRQRRIDGVDLFFTVLLAVAALVSLIGGGPRVLLFKDAALSLAVGAWVLGTGCTGRPLAFQLGQRLHRGPAALARAGLWEDSAEFRQALRVLTLGWGTEQLLDGGLGTLAAATLPTDTVPLLTRVLSLLLLTMTAAATAVYARRFRTRHGHPLLGAPDTGGGDVPGTGGGDRPRDESRAPDRAGASAPDEVHAPAPAKGGIRTPAPPRPPARRPS